MDMELKQWNSVINGHLIKGSFFKTKNVEKEFL
jgi:hypothetical protein